jgi:hypothetical protein
MRSYASSQKHSSPSREAFAIPPLCWRCVQWDSSRRAENTAGWQRCRNRYQARSVACLCEDRGYSAWPMAQPMRLFRWRTARGLWVQFGAALGAAPPASLSGMLLLKLLCLLSVALLHRAVSARQAGWRPRACGPCENARRNMPWIRASRDSVLWLNENVTSTTG